MLISKYLQKKATRWRTERNWWISALTFTIYWYVGVIWRLCKLGY